MSRLPQTRTRGALSDEVAHSRSLLDQPILHIATIGHAGKDRLQGGEAPILAGRDQFVAIEEVRADIAGTEHEMHRPVAAIGADEADQRGNAGASADQDDRLAAMRRAELGIVTDEDGHLIANRKDW